MEGGAYPCVPFVQVDGICKTTRSLGRTKRAGGAAGDHLVIDAWHLSHSRGTLGVEDPGTVNASANGRGYAFPQAAHYEPLMVVLAAGTGNIPGG